MSLPAISNPTAVTAATATAAVPPQVRKEGAGAVQGYRAALGFEATLVEQMLSQALPEMSGSGAGGGEGEEEASAFGSGGDPSLSTLPETVAGAVVGAGGLGLAKDMYRSFETGR
jgi:hypothetical protein